MKKYLYFIGDSYYPANDLVLVTDEEVSLEELKKRFGYPIGDPDYIELVILDTETNKWETKLLHGTYYGHPDHIID